MKKDIIKERIDVWQRLKDSKKPVVIYGMGDGAQKIIDVCNGKGIEIKDIFASDEYVRGHSFSGYKILKYGEAVKKHGDFIIVLAFAVRTGDMIGRIKALSQAHELVAPDVPVSGGGLFDMEYARKNLSCMERAYEALADDLSKKTYGDIINFKLSGKIEYLFDCTTDKSEALSGILNLSKHENYLDVGAYDGDTIREFLNETGGKYDSITAVEPDIKNYKKLIKWINQSGYTDITAINKLVWNKQATVGFNTRAGRNSSVNIKESSDTVCAESIDSIVSGRKISFIKLDVEGSEKMALVGATDTIKHQKPKLLVSAYHRNDDLFSLIECINEIRVDYKFYLRHHSYIPAWDTNIYAV